jgi:hypothetical protein
MMFRYNHEIRKYIITQIKWTGMKYLIFIILLVTTVITAGCVTPNNSTTVPPAPLINNNTVISTTGTVVKDVLNITINSAVKKTLIGRSTNKGGDIFLVLDISIQNYDKNIDFKYKDTSFAIYDKLNNNRRTAITSQLNTGGLNNPFTSGTIPIKSKMSGQIVFGVMDNSNSYKLYVSDSKGTVLTSIDNISVP